jgi:ribonucleoside-diphosphate reductase alpha chain
VLSIPDAIAQVMTNHMQSNQAKLNLQFAQTTQGLKPAQELLQQTKMEEVTATVKSTGEVAASAAPAKKQADTSIANLGVAPECPECGNILAMSEGCMMCHGCGYSKCA